jgi:hypothetical protein
MEKNNSPNLIRGLLYGTVNGVMCIPVMISFTAIIFRDEAFSAYMPSLVG